MPTAVFTKAQRRQLDGFQAKCLRSILGIQPAFLSHISNEAVRLQAGWKPASILLLQHQLVLLGKVLRQGPTSPLHRACFIEGTLRPATSRYVRKVGRPCYEWVSAVLPEALRIAGGTDRLLAEFGSSPRRVSLEADGEVFYLKLKSRFSSGLIFLRLYIYITCTLNHGSERA